MSFTSAVKMLQLLLRWEVILTIHNHPLMYPRIYHPVLFRSIMSPSETLLCHLEVINTRVLTSPNYSFGFVPPMLGTQLTPFDNSESQTRDISRLLSFVVHQPFDPASCYAKFYHSGVDSDGRLPPFPSAGVTTKYNGNVTVLPAPNSQSPQEVELIIGVGVKLGSVKRYKVIHESPT